MRPSEARNLRLADFSSEGIIVREAKFRKSRFLPLHPSSVASLEVTWSVGRKCVVQTITFLFRLEVEVSRKTGVERVFRRVLEACGIPERPVGAHLDLWISAILLLYEPLRRAQMAAAVFGSTCSRSAPTWDTATVQHTYWYLENTPELMRDIADVTEAFVNGGGK